MPNHLIPPQIVLLKTGRLLLKTYLLHTTKNRAMWTSDVDTTAAMMRDAANTAPLKIISSLVSIILSKTPVKIPGKTKFLVNIGHTSSLYENITLNQRKCVLSI